MASHLFEAFWTELTISEGSRPALSEDEVECLMRGRVHIVDGPSNRVILKEGIVTLTSHRIIWYKDSKAFQGHLSKVTNARKSRNIFKPSSRVHVFLAGQNDQRGEQPATKIDFVHGGRDEFLDQLRYVLQMKEWERAAANAKEGHKGGTTTSSEKPLFSARKAGVGGIIRQAESNRAAQDKLASEAFSDLNALMTKAREVVGVIERYATVIASKAASKAEGGGTGVGDENKENTELQGLLLDMGIANPVTRFSAGSLYHQELAKQLADFLKVGNNLAASGGMITLHDAFCLFNRARGTELISPEDLLDACQLLSYLHLDMRLRRFPSGVLVIEADDFSDDRISERLRALAEEEGSFGGLTALDVSSHLRVSITLAQEFLKTAEARWLLCRDESVQGVLFYPNRFPDYIKLRDKQ